MLTGFLAGCRASWARSSPSCPPPKKLHRSPHVGPGCVRPAGSPLRAVRCLRCPDLCSKWTAVVRATSYYRESASKRNKTGFIQFSGSGFLEGFIHTGPRLRSRRTLPPLGKEETRPKDLGDNDGASLARPTPYLPNKKAPQSETTSRPKDGGQRESHRRVDVTPHTLNAMLGNKDSEGR